MGIGMNRIVMSNLIFAENGSFISLSSLRDVNDFVFETWNIPKQEQILLSKLGVPYSETATGNIYVFDRRSLSESRDINDFISEFHALDFTQEPFACKIELFKEHLNFAFCIQEQSKEMTKLITIICTGIFNHLL